jgi:Zn-dependent metalloprotease
MKRSHAGFLVLVCACLSASMGLAQPRGNAEAREAALRRLRESTGGAAVVSMHKATGAARFIRLQPGTRGGLSRVRAMTAREKQEQSVAFFRDFGAALGIGDPRLLRLASTATDDLGETHLTWKQFHGAVPVFAGTIKTHFDASHQLKAVSGTAIPDITVDQTPRWSGERAAPVARRSVAAERGHAEALRIGTVSLYVYREGLAQGVPGENHLAWEIEVTDGAGIRDFVYVGAHTGKVIDRISAVHDTLNRRAYDGHDLAFVPPNYPQGAYWLEGQTFPTGSEEANNMILASQDTYDLFNDAFGRDSFDGAGATMDAIFDRGYGCPNASWNGVFISFCPGVTTDDVTAHEWGHAYTEHTHNLIYAWQPGALNEAYSDIWGEVVDLINGRGSDAPGGGRSPGACSTFSPAVGQLRLNAPASVAGDYFAQAAFFGPELTPEGVTGDVVAALDAADAAGPSTLDGCSAITNAAAVAGKVAIINRGTCEFSRKVLNAQNAGAIAVIIANNVATGLPGMGAGVDAPSVTIPSIGVQQAVGNSIRTALTTNVVNATLLAKPGTDETYRWLMGEDSSPESFDGAIRDMWNPTCFANPGKVTDTAFYVCSAGDQGGVHTNSGVPNHGFALLVDGGTYNGRTIAPIGITKAAHVYFRAQSVYQVEDSDFTDHADALEASCQDLLGQPLNALTGGPSGETIVASDCEQVTTMTAAVELRTPPTFCNFAPLLNPALPALCSSATTSGVVQNIQSFDLETDPTASWTATRTVTSPDFTERDWTWVNALPSGRAGSGFFAPNPNIGTCAPGGDESGVLHLTSPPIALPMTTSFARATFEHWVATEAGFDGGNVKISVDGGPWQLVPPSEFTFNNYNALLVSAEGGNTNPLAGQPAWTGNNAGTVKGGSWGRSHLNLGNFAGPGDTIRLRWDLGSDGCAGSVGWYLDNLNVFSCTPNIPAVSVADIAVAEGDAGRSEAFFTVRLSEPTITPVAVSFEIVAGTAQHGNDFEAARGGTLVIPAGRTSGQIAVVVKGDIVPEGSETFFLRLTGATNATISDPEAQATIGEDDTTPPGPPGD